METQLIATYKDIDWLLLWRNARSLKSWRSKGAKEWDKKAASFRQRTADSPYVSAFLSHLHLEPDSTVLDVGCGPGTLALPIARRVKEVTAIDYSEKMLAQLEKHAAEQGLNNIRTLLCAWEDDWPSHGLKSHDVAIASRSMNIDNLSEGIKKLDSHATKRVYIADRIDPSPFDPDAFAAIGRPFESGPDYIYTVNILYHMGIHPSINHIELADTNTCTDFQAAYDSYAWMFRDLTSSEQGMLRQFIRSRVLTEDEHGITIKHHYPQRWALISWATGRTPSRSVASAACGKPLGNAENE